MPNGKPNALVFWGDDIGISNLSCYRIASEGMRFTDSYVEQSCTAGRAAFIGGQSPCPPCTASAQDFIHPPTKASF